MAGLSSAARYDIAMGRWSRRLAGSFLDYADPPAGGPLIDVGCGTGSLALAAAMRFPAAGVLGVDLLPEYVAAALDLAAPNARFENGDAHALPVPDDAFSAALSQLVLNDIPDPERAVREMVRVTRPGGRVAAAVWDRLGGLGFLRLFLDAAALAEAEGEGLRSALLDVRLASEDDLAALWCDHGLRDVRAGTLSIRMEFLDFRDYWESLMGVHQQVRDFVDGLPLEASARLQAAVRRAYLAGRSDGRRSFIAAALAVRGDVRKDT
ncbi:class I SAM-dependent methyltransferase [Novispirillum sp. DQ9]|uniref:class I SAM-dependent methyltransferase n=1 Tax=Novispirillum sp. DQ9 TaxID=3398612 RepID=UPI003C7DA02F